MSKKVNAEKPLYQAKAIKKHFPVTGGILRRTIGQVKALDGVDLDIYRGETISVIGESGCGKTTLGRMLAVLQKPTDGELTFDFGNGLQNVVNLDRAEELAFRKKVQMIFQDPFGSLNPRLSIFQIVGEALEIHFPEMTREDRRARVAALMKQVGLKAEMMERYPHEFSGGQRQRIGIARALAVEPKFIVCDEPVSALDVSVQAQIVNLLQDLQEELGLTYLFIAHDLAVVQHISHKVLVMYHGKIVESASAEEIYENPQHEYTRKLLAAVPEIA